MNRFSAAGAMICLALAILVLPLRWVIAAVIAAGVHELCHYWAVRLFGGTVLNLQIGLHGAKMQVKDLSWGRELLCALAGPAGSLALLLASRWFPRVAIWGGMQGIYNLLPIYPMDGGRAVRCLIAMFFSAPTAENVSDLIQRISLLLLLGCGIYGCFSLKLGLFPLMVAIFACLRGYQGKIPCKLLKNSLQ